MLPILRLLAGSTSPRQRAFRMIGLFFLILILVIWGINTRRQLPPSGIDGDFGQTLAPASERGVLAIGASVTGSLAADERHSWTFEGEMGQHVNVRMLSDWDSVVELLPSDGTQALATDPNYGGADQALVCNFPLPANGTYRVVVRGGTGNTGMETFGDYTLHVEQEAYNEERLLSYGETVAGTVTTCDGDFYTIPVEAGDTLQVTLTPESSVELYLRLLTSRSSRDLVAFGSDAVGAEGQAQQMIAVDVLEATTFFIQVSKPYAIPEVDYTLTISRTTGEATQEF